MKRPLLLLLFLLAAIAVLAHKAPQRTALANVTVSDFWRQHEQVYAVQIPRGSNGGFSVQARINGIAADGGRYRRDLGRLDLRNREGRWYPAGATRIQCRRSNRGRPNQGGAALARSTDGRQAGRTLGAGAGGAARPDED